MRVLSSPIKAFNSSWISGSYLKLSISPSVGISSILANCSSSCTLKTPEELIKFGISDFCINNGSKKAEPCKVQLLCMKCKVLNLFDDLICEFRCFEKCCSLHQVIEIYGNRFILDGFCQCINNGISSFFPAHVFQHHNPTKDYR